MIFEWKDRNFVTGLLSIGILFAALLALLDGAQAAVFCVDNSSDLQTAFNIAGSNGQDNTVQVVQGTYLTPDGEFNCVSYNNHHISVLGGYTPGCTDRVLNPANTILDGRNLNRVMSIYVMGSANIHVQGFTFRNGSTTGYNSGAGLHFGGAADTTGDYTIDNNIFVDNHTTYFGGGLGGGSDLGITRIENNLIVNNSARWNGAADLISNGTAYITNNTVFGNTATEGEGALALAGSGTGGISNNIFFGNETTDLVIDSNKIVLLNNDIGVLQGVPAPGSGGNLNVVPEFVGGGNYQLLKGSLLIDAGTTEPPGGLPVTDLEGNPRIGGPSPDIGAYEYGGLSITPEEGTIGTIIDVMGSEFGRKRGKVSIGATALKIIEWTIGWIQASLTKSLPEGIYDVKIEPKGTDPIVLEGSFTLMPPLIDSTEPESGSTNDEITLRGQFFGTKKGKVTLGGKNCRVKAWAMDPTNGASEVQFVVPKALSLGTHELKITNGVGLDTTNFIVE